MDMKVMALDDDCPRPSDKEVDRCLAYVDHLPGGVEHGEIHTCYYCSREGTDVNRLAVYGPRMNEPQYGYCCDDGDACDARTKA